MSLHAPKSVKNGVRNREWIIIRGESGPETILILNYRSFRRMHRVKIFDFSSLWIGWKEPAGMFGSSFRDTVLRDK